MKKILLIIILLLSLTSCIPRSQSNNGSDVKPGTAEYTIKDFYPFKENIRMKYTGTGNEYAEQDTYVERISGNRIQLRIINPGTTLGQVLENVNGELRIISSVGEFYYLEDITSESNDNPEILLKEPIKKGTSWALPDGRKRYISEISKRISTPLGDYDALEVTTEGSDYTMYDYYALNIGMVKRIFKSGDYTIETSLEKLENNKPILQTIQYYYPDFLNDKIVCTENKEEFETNHDIKDTFEKYFRSSPSRELTSLMSSNTSINKLYINREENRVYIDFSKEFITEMNAGTSLESMVIQSAVNTLGVYYNTDKVCITIEGRPYESGHILLKQGDCFYVDYKNVEKYKQAP